jgi:hypothetical protein
MITSFFMIHLLVVECAVWKLLYAPRMPGFVRARVHRIRRWKTMAGNDLWSPSRVDDDSIVVGSDALPSTRLDRFRRRDGRTAVFD